MTQVATKKNKFIENPLISDDADIDQTYNGLSGCACGCCGNYTEQGVNTGKARSRINKINVAWLYNPQDVQVFDWDDRIMYEIITSVGQSPEDYERVTRVYVNKVTT